MDLVISPVTLIIILALYLIIGVIGVFLLRNYNRAQIKRRTVNPVLGVIMVLMGPLPLILYLIKSMGKPLPSQSDSYFKS